MNEYLEINSEETFVSIINSLETSYQKILDSITKEKENVEKINATYIWTGRAQQVTYEKYKLLNENYSSIDYSLDLYIKFMRKTLEDYKMFVAAQNKNIDEQSRMLDVNS